MRRAVPWVLLAVAAWVFADLYFRVDLPGARHLAFWLFRGVTAPLAVLASDLEIPFARVLLVWGVGAAAAHPFPTARRLFWQGSAAVAAVGVAVSVAVSFLLERSLAAGLVCAVAVATWIALRRGPSETLRISPGWALALVLASAASAAYAYALVFSSPEGYPLLESVGASVRAGELAPRRLFVQGAGLLSLLGWGAALAWSRGWLGGAALAGLVGWCAARPLHGDGVGLLSESLGLLAAAAIASLVTWALGDLRVSWDPRTWLLRSLPFAVAAVPLFGHAYGARIFDCPAPGTQPGLDVVADLPGVFRLQLNEAGDRAVMSVRSRAALMTLPLQPQVGEPSTPLQLSATPTDSQPYAVPEDMSWSPNPDRFYALLSSRDENTWLGEPTEDTGPVRSSVVVLDGDGGSVDQLMPLVDLCWTSALEWNEAQRRLYVGCERPHGLFRWEPGSDRVEHAPADRALGDIESIAFHPDGQRIFTGSLWTSPWLHVLDSTELRVRDRAYVGGGNYVVALDSGTDRLFVSSFFASRVRVLDAGTLELVGRIPVGLGARAVGVDPGRGLVVASSLYDGRLRVADTATGEVLASYAVGGHVKDVAIDAERGLAWFWGQCGVQRLDLGVATGRAAR